MRRLSLLTGALALILGCGPAGATPQKGDKAKLFKSVDENLKPVDMKDMIKGRPLVLIVGSAS